MVVFDASSVCVKDKTSGRILLHASSTGNVYPLAIPASPIRPLLLFWILQFPGIVISDIVEWGFYLLLKIEI